MKCARKRHLESAEKCGKVQEGVGKYRGSRKTTKTRVQFGVRDLPEPELDHMNLNQGSGSGFGKSPELNRQSGAEGWYMPVVAEFVPGLVHMSLFLFFLGLGESLFTVNTTIGATTTIPIAVCSLPYIFSIFVPVLYPQSPFRNSFSGLIWCLVQKMHLRTYLDRSFGNAHKPVSLNMFEGQMQLAMEENDGCQDRDVRAIEWLIQTMTLRPNHFFRCQAVWRGKSPHALSQLNSAVFLSLLPTNLIPRLSDRWPQQRVRLRSACRHSFPR
ncbi:hypothetical protein EDB83DRAFT_2310502 [Lactarius deliciosus]|nr:hypothetical protein EDB83DRAFT_2310502 [Lactarius deliciosus]